MSTTALFKTPPNDTERAMGECRLGALFLLLFPLHWLTFSEKTQKQHRERLRAPPYIDDSYF
jgi:hypothetical protein